MSHVPETPELYACTSCQAIFAGSVHGEVGDHHFTAPEECSACGETHLVEIEDYVHMKAE
jgi:hypothetical protein